MLLNNKTKDYMGISTNYLCPEKVDFFVQGMLSSDDTWFIQIAVRECTQSYIDEKYNKTKKCMNMSESARVAKQLKLNIVF